MTQRPPKTNSEWLFLKDTSKIVSMSLTDFSISLCSITCGLTISLLCIICIFWKLKLNQYMKLILIIYTFINTVALVFRFIANIMYYRNDLKHTWLSCTIVTMSRHILFMNIVQINCISIVRFYNANLATQARIARPTKVLPFIGLITIILVVGRPLLTLRYFSREFRTPVSDCLDLKLPEHPIATSPIFITLTFMVLMNASGLFCDIALYKLVKKRNQTHPTSNTIPFKTVAGNSNDDLHIPIRATLLSLLSFILVLLMFAICKYVGSSKQLEKFSIISVVLPCFPLLIIYFTIKSKKPVTQSISGPPQGQNQPHAVGLQFHENEVEENEAPKEEIEMDSISEIIADQPSYDQNKQRKFQRKIAFDANDMQANAEVYM